MRDYQRTGRLKAMGTSKDYSLVANIFSTLFPNDFDRVRSAEWGVLQKRAYPWQSWSAVGAGLKDCCRHGSACDAGVADCPVFVLYDVECGGGGCRCMIACMPSLHGADRFGALALWMFSS